jgi:hypothetical protein
MSRRVVEDNRQFLAALGAGTYRLEITASDSGFQPAADFPVGVHAGPKPGGSLKGRPHKARSSERPVLVGDLHLH